MQSLVDGKTEATRREHARESICLAWLVVPAPTIAVPYPDAVHTGIHHDQRQTEERSAVNKLGRTCSRHLEDPCNSGCHRRPISPRVSVWDLFVQTLQGNGWFSGYQIRARCSRIRIFPQLPPLQSRWVPS